MIPAATAQVTQRRKNPYRGPRAFSRGDQLPNRQRETQELANRVVAERIVLLHSPSGAGKTSLVEAAVVPELIAEGLCPTPRLRVNEPVDDGTVRNRYIYSLVCYLLADYEIEENPGDLTLGEAVQRWRDLVQADSARTVLIIDQLEEVLTLNPADWDVKEGFFRELGALLREQPVWTLFSMREDYMGGLDRYLRFLPGCLRSRYRLDFFSWADAIRAMQIPSARQRVDFKQDAAEALAHRLAVTTIQRPDKEPETVRTPYIEPFQLQVVCRQLWKSVRKIRGDDFTTIEVADIEQYADIDKALTLYFGDTVANVVARTLTEATQAEADPTQVKADPAQVKADAAQAEADATQAEADAAQAKADERKIRDWFESDLITKQNLRTQTLNPPETAGDPQRMLTLLEDGYLIRGDVRGSSTWYELTHDRLITPVQASNDAWRRDNLEPWQAAAYTWNANDRQRAFLLQPAEFPKAHLRKGSPGRHLDAVEQAFLTASLDQARQNGKLARTRSTMSLLAWTVIVQTLVIAGLVIALVVK